MFTALPPIFAGLEPDAMNEAASMLTEASFEASETLLQEGDADFSMAFIVQGHVEISVQGTRIGTAGPRDMIGEAEMFAQLARMATVTAASGVMLQILPVEAYLELCERGNPIIHKLERAVLRRLGERLNELNSRIAMHSPGEPLDLPAPTRGGLFERLTSPFRRADSGLAVDSAAVFMASPHFAWADPALVAEVASVFTVRTVERGEVLCRYQEPASTLFFLVSGAADVVVHTREGYGERVGTCRGGSLFGDAGMVSGQPRLATVVATERTTLLTLERDRFLALLDAEAASASVLRQGLIRNLVQQLGNTLPRVIALGEAAEPPELTIRGTPVSTVWRD